jgi:hypothetical protein
MPVFIGVSASKAAGHEKEAVPKQKTPPVLLYYLHNRIVAKEWGTMKWAGCIHTYVQAAEDIWTLMIPANL